MLLNLGDRIDVLRWRGCCGYTGAVSSAPDSASSLSDRAQALLRRSPLPVYLHEHFARGAAGVDAEGRPYVPLCVAENGLVFDLLRPKLDASRGVPARALGYDAMIGAREFREALAVGLERLFLGRRFEPEQIAVLAGAGSVLELLFYTLGDPGDGVLVPTPSYAGFWGDLEIRDGLKIVPVPTSDADGFRLTAERLDRAVAGAGRRVRALLFTSPNNPVGTVYTPAEISEVLDWAERAGIHVVLDEIYALSVHGARPFTSGARVVPRLGPMRHIVWAFSKDFAASGLRCGVLISENEAVLAAVDGLAYWAATSGDTQHLLKNMLEDEAWLSAYVTENQRRLAAAYRATTEALAAAGIPFVAAEAGFFCLVDLRRFLEAPNWAGEEALWRRILARTNVNMTPGAACRAPEAGFFRLCFAALPTDQVVEAIRRIGAALVSL